MKIQALALALLAAGALHAQEDSALGIVRPGYPSAQAGEGGVVTLSSASHSCAAPALHFSLDPTTGIVWEGDVGDFYLCVKGVRAAEFQFSGGVANEYMLGPVINDDTTDTLGVSVFEAQMQLTSGSASVPSLAFSFDAGNHTGIYRVGSNDIGITTNGTLRWDVSTTLISQTLPMAMAEVAAPSGAAGVEMLWPDLTAHRLKVNDNNGGALTLALLSDPFSSFTALGTLPFANGGFGFATAAAGDLFYASAINTPAKLTVGGNNTALISNGTVPSWGAITDSFLSGTVSLTHGGMGFSTGAAGDLPYFSALNTFAKLTVGASGTILNSDGTVPRYSTLATLNIPALNVANTWTQAQTWQAPTIYASTTITPSATPTIDFSLRSVQTIAVAADVTFSTSNIAANSQVTLIATNSGVLHNVAWPASWIWDGDTPTTVAATTGELFCSLYSTSTTDASVHAQCNSQGAYAANLGAGSGVVKIANGGTNSSTALSGSSVIHSDGTHMVQGPTGAIIVATSTFTSGTSFTTGANTHAIFGRLCGAGGGAGGTTTAAASAAVGGGGGGGGYAEATLTVSPSTSYSYAIGTAGTAGSSSGGNGGLGGDTTLTIGGTTVTAKGGLGGLGESAGSTIAYVDGGAGGPISTNGDVNGAGQPGGYGSRSSGLIGTGGSGGPGPAGFGGGGLGSSTAGAGAVGVGKCSGGAGGLVLNNSTAVTGGAGTGGELVIQERE